MNNFRDKVIWITGASSGIGEELAYAFANEGASLVLTSRNREKLELVKKKCLEKTDVCLVQPMDLSNPDGMDAIVQSVVGQTGKVDVLINNAGRSQRSLAKDTPVSIDREIMELNFFGVIHLTKLLLPFMVKRENGHLVVISSVVGKFGFPLRTAYAASKHALQGFFEALRFELQPFNIDVTIVSPGRIHTNISINAVTHTGESYKKMDDGQAQGMPADLCAKKIIKAIRNRKKDVLIGKMEVVMVYIRRFFPWLFYRLASKVKN
ncbi:SDR family oxidoreductase [Natronoflexus pectinivorans]|uniref:Short-subunit dehydrogenase n=1 Tax=Natronoflexus pectinivorans TaxID=682526 RepID=A0A4R2GGL1_9BACT|nr:SDR family oxidoreductase [Natronoflexus pectinivorans]TCO07449.1 short-subunit dehydrogenase [Natronoflexus pectinivorans]